METDHELLFSTLSLYKQVCGCFLDTQARCLCLVYLDVRAFYIEQFYSFQTFALLPLTAAQSFGQYWDIS